MVLRLNKLVINRLVCNKVIKFQYGNQIKQLIEGTNIVRIKVLTVLEQIVLLWT